MSRLRRVAYRILSLPLLKASACRPTCEESTASSSISYADKTGARNDGLRGNIFTPPGAAHFRAAYFLGTEHDYFRRAAAESCSTDARGVTAV